MGNKFDKSKMDTTKNDINSEILNGKAVFVLYNSQLYSYSGIDNDGTIQFFRVYNNDINNNGDNTINIITVNSSNVWNIYTYALADTSLSNLSATGKEVLDGQWVSSFQEAIGSTAQTINANTTKDIEFSSLPAKNCEVMFSISQSTNYDLGIYSYLLTSTTNRALKQGCTTVIMPVSSNKKIRIINLGSGAASINFVRMCGYRVLGTNTNT